MYKFLVAIALIIIIGISAILFFQKDDLSHIKLKTEQAEHGLMVELAKTPEEIRQGLMHREELEDGRGMLFVYEEPHIPSFWMKNMLISLDIIFIGEDLQIKHIAYEVPPCPQDEICATYSPTVPVQYVLEVPGGYSEERNINLGDRLTLQ